MAYDNRNRDGVFKFKKFLYSNKDTLTAAFLIATEGMDLSAGQPSLAVIQQNGLAAFHIFSVAVGLCQNKVGCTIALEVAGRLHISFENLVGQPGLFF